MKQLMNDIQDNSELIKEHAGWICSINSAILALLERPGLGNKEDIKRLTCLSDYLADRTYGFGAEICKLEFPQNVTAKHGSLH